MELKGQTVYVVNSFDKDDAISDYRVFADKNEALKYEAKANKREKQFGGHAYTDTVTIS